MTEPTYFSVVADYRAVLADTAMDFDADPQIQPVSAVVTFRPVLRDGDAILAVDASPRPIGFVAAPVVGKLDTAGRLVLRDDPDGTRVVVATFDDLPAEGVQNSTYYRVTETGKCYRYNGSGYVEIPPYQPVRLLANTPLLQLSSPLYYTVTFSQVIYNGRVGKLNGFTFEAPNSDIPGGLNLIEVMRQPGQPASGITRYGANAVRVDEGHLIFSFDGVDIGQPINLSAIGVDTDINAEDIVDSRPFGRGVVRLSTDDDWWDYVGTVPLDSLPSTAVGESLLTATDQNAAQTSLGGTSVGKAVFGAESGDAAQTSIGGTTVGKSVFTAASTDAAQASIGGTPVGKAVFTAPTQSDARTAIGATSTADVTAAVAASSTVTDAAAAAVTTAIAGRNLLEAAKSFNDGVGLAITDASRRILFWIRPDGSVKIARLDMSTFPAGSLPLSKLEGAYFALQGTETGYLATVVDKSGRILFGVRNDGSIAGKVAMADGSITPAKLAPSLAARIPPNTWDTPPVPEVLGSTPSRKLFLTRSTGRKLIDSANDPREDSIVVMPDNVVLYTGNAGRKAVLTDDSIVPAVPDWSQIVCYGDSLTNSVGGSWTSANNWPGVLDPLISASVTNLGVTGSSSDEMALKQGGYVIKLSVSGGSIPASGGVTCTSTQHFGLRWDRGYSILGSLNGVPGTLSYPAGGTIGDFTFTRTTSGSAVASAGTYDFISDYAAANETYPAIIFAGRNDIAYTAAGVTITDPVARVTAAIAAMVARLRVYRREYIIIGPTTSTTELAGTDGYFIVKAINSALSATYGARYLNIRKYLVEQAIYDLGITPNSGDTTAMAADTLPPSIMLDTIHYTVNTAAKVALQVKAKIDTLGWML